MSNLQPALTIQSHKGPYNVYFESKPFENVQNFEAVKAHYIIDSNVARLYKNELKDVLENESVLIIEANEYTKNLTCFPDYVDSLVKDGVKRGHTLVAIGGGVTQDITCFLATTLFRGLDWVFFPTTLLAQADSCIGSKSSINVGSVKNLMGTFTPPKHIFISTDVLATLEPKDICSGIGEMLKVHVIDGPQSFDKIAAQFRNLKDKPVMEEFLLNSLKMKQKLIEVDEFDKGVRNVMNYGHSFGHAIEAATDFGIPHGIAVTIGMDMANSFAVTTGVMDISHYERMHATLKQNYADFKDVEVPLEPFYAAIAKDKKNIGKDLSLIIPHGEAQVKKIRVPFDEVFKKFCEDFFSKKMKQAA